MHNYSLVGKCNQVLSHKTQNNKTMLNLNLNHQTDVSLLIDNVGEVSQSMYFQQEVPSLILELKF